MSDPNKYINYYVEHSLAMVHEHINSQLQLKTQLRVAQDQLTEKDAVIASLQDELGKHTSNEQEMNQAKQQASNWENSYNDMKNKVAHMDTLTGQIGEAKRLLVEKNVETQRLTTEVEDLKKQVSEKDAQIKELKKLVPSAPSPKKTINTKKKSTTPSEAEVKKVESVKPPIVPYKAPEPGTKPNIVPYKSDEAIKVVKVVDEQEEADDF
jgi:chromosome segregation ATPase